LNSLDGGAVVVEGKKSAQDFFSSSGADGIADPVVLRQGFDFVEIMVKVEVGPSVLTSLNRYLSIPTAIP
jgi:hypothetical protein